MKTYEVQITKIDGTSYRTSGGYPTARRAQNECRRMERLSFVVKAEVVEEAEA